jgi:tetratricopeptide (TPR) repeat protein
MLADSLAYACWLHSFAGDYEAAVASSDESFKISQAANNLWGQSYSRYMVGLVYWNRGELDRAIEVMEEAIRLGSEAGFVVPGVTTRCWLALLYGDLGAVEVGIEIADQAVTAAETHWERDLGFTLACLAQLYLLKGDLSEAATIFQQADHTKPLNDHWAQLAMWLRGQLALAQGHPDQAVALAIQCVTELRRFHNRIFFIPDALYLQGQALLALDQPREAYERFLEARAEATEIGSRRTLWKVLATLADIETDPIKAGHLRQQAREIIEYIADHAPPELHASFLGLQAVQKLLSG